MAENLFPVIGSEDGVGAKTQYDQRYKRSYQWDFKAGDFIRNGANQVAVCDGLEAYRTWCIKAVSTERRTCPAYPAEIGAEMVTAFRKPSQKAQESAIERTVRETLLANPRTEYVRNFSFVWDSDSVNVSFTVKGIHYDGFRMAVIGAEGDVMVPIEAVEAGRGSNVGTDVIILQNKPLDGVSSVTNPEPVTGGTEVESDDDYYARIQLENGTESFSHIGNDNDYKRWALSVDGVGTCIVMPAWNGPGTVKLVLVDSNGDPANEELSGAVYDYIVSPADRSRRLLPAGTAELTVAGAEIVGISYQCTGLVYDTGKTDLAQIQADFKNVIETVYERAKSCGKLVYHQAESLITDLPGVENYDSFKMNGVEADIALAEDEYPKTAALDFS